jgi:hypothetical protein
MRHPEFSLEAVGCPVVSSWPRGSDEFWGTLVLHLGSATLANRKIVASGITLGGRGK